MISPLTVLSSSISSVPLFSRRHIFRHPFLVSHRLLQCLLALQRASDLTLSSYVSSILYPRHLSSYRPYALLTVRRTLESHKALRRIFHAAISASRDERRYSSRRPIRPEKNGEISFERGQTKFPWPLIKRPDAERQLRKEGGCNWTDR